MALTLADITCEYAEGSPLSYRALESVSLSIEPGELVLLLGPTGSGKTTLLRAAAGLLPSSAGTVEVDGVRIGVRGAQRAAVGMLFQRPESQFFALSVEEDCAFGPRNLGRSDKDARADGRAALAQVGLDPSTFGPREPWTLSGGEARRAALAGVLAMRPRYLLLDEPTAGLDAVGRDSVAAVIERTRHTAGVLVVTHDPDLLIRRADRVLVMSEGRTAFSGDVPAFLAALPALTATGAAEAPEVLRTLMLAERRLGRAGATPTLDVDEAASSLARMCAEGGVPR